MKHYYHLFGLTSILLSLQCVPSCLFGQRQHVVKGTVMSEDEPLQGVTVTVLGTLGGVITDKAGNYSIEVSPSDSLQFSFVGMEIQRVAVDHRAIIDVRLYPLGDVLSEVEIVAFGTQRKESVVGSIASVRPDELRIPSSNLTTALAGRVAGMIAYQRSGEPGADNADFFVRGVTSFGYANTPLILVDGVEIPSSELARMQVDDIASFSIMRDASATALFGARGANGVILITTKEGKEGKTQTSIRYETSISGPTRKVELADPVTYMKLANEAVTTRNPLEPTPYTQEKIEKTETGVDPLLYPAVDWHSMLFKDYAVNNRLNLNVSGGGNVARYYIAGTYNRDNGVLKVDGKNNFNNNIDLRNYQLRSNVNVNISESTEVVVRLNTTWSDYTGPISDGTSMHNLVIRTNPVLFQPYYLPDRNYEFAEHILFGNAGNGEYINPYAEMVKGYRNSTSSRFMAQFEINQQLDFIIKGLKISGLYNTTRYANSAVTRSYNPFYYTIGSYDALTSSYNLVRLNPNTGTEYLTYTPSPNGNTVEGYFQSILSYNRGFSSAHVVGGSLVYTMRHALQTNAGTLQQSLPYRNLGLAGRLTYAYGDRYFVEGNFGYNGSERFAASHRFGFFPSVGGAWFVSKTDLFTIKT